MGLHPAPLPAAGAGFGPAQPNVQGPQPRYARRYETSALHATCAKAKFPGSSSRACNVLQARPARADSANPSAALPAAACADAGAFLARPPKIRVPGAPLWDNPSGFRPPTGAYRPDLAKNSTLCCFSGARSPLHRGGKGERRPLPSFGKIASDFTEIRLTLALLARLRPHKGR